MNVGDILHRLFIAVDCIDKMRVLLAADLITFVPSTCNVNLFAKNCCFFFNWTQLRLL